MNIGDVADQLNMPASTIRYYEKVGLLKEQQRIAGKRVFDNQALNALEFIQLAQNAGFSIEEMKVLLHDTSHSPLSSCQWRKIAKAKRFELQDKMKKLQKMDNVLGQLESCKCSTLNECVNSCLKS